MYRSAAPQPVPPQPTYRSSVPLPAYRPEPAAPPREQPRPSPPPPPPQAPIPQYRSAAPAPAAAPPRYAPEPEPRYRSAPPEPVYRSTAPVDAVRGPVAPASEPRSPERPRFAPPPEPAPRYAPAGAVAPVEAPAPRPPVPTPVPAPRPAVPPPGSLPAPGFARGLPAPPAPAPAPPAPRPAPPPPAQQPAPRYGPGLPAPAAPAPPAPARPTVVQRPTGALEIERVRYEDLAGILDLVNADLLPGQPTVGRHALDMAMRGESPVDASWWRELSNVQVAVARRGATVVGATSYAVAAADRSGWLLWLHARENRPVVEALADHVMAELAGSSHLYAYWIATALSLGLEALPVEHRQVTHEVLTSRGLTGRDSWRYLALDVDRSILDGPGDDVAAVEPTSGPGEIPAWRLVMGDGQEPVASAEIALGGHGCGVLWWIDVEPAERGRGTGRRLLRQALRYLALRGAQSVAALVDHADPRERDPRAILRLLASAGFEEVDRLWSYESPRKRSR